MLSIDTHSSILKVGFLSLSDTDTKLVIIYHRGKNMALKPAAGQTTWERNDWVVQAVQDAERGRTLEASSTTFVQPVVANAETYQTSYDWAYGFGQYFSQFFNNRNYI